MTHLSRRLVLCSLLASGVVGVSRRASSKTPVADRVERTWAMGGTISGETLELERTVVLSPSLGWPSLVGCKITGTDAFFGGKTLVDGRLSTGGAIRDCYFILPSFRANDRVELQHEAST